LCYPLEVTFIGELKEKKRKDACPLKRNKLKPFFNYDASKVHPTIIDNQESKTLFEVEVARYKTTMLFTQVSKKYNGSIALYGGLGAKSSTFGIGASMGHIANKCLKENFKPFSFQNPLYFHDKKEYGRRMDLVGTFRSLDAQIEWMVNTLRFVITHNNPSQKLVVGARSSGASLLLEAYHRYLTMGLFQDVFSKISHILIMGSVDPRTFSAWHIKERKWLEIQDKIFDAFSFESEPFLFQKMSYLSHKLKSKEKLKIPNTTFIIGSNDELTTIQDQFDIARTFYQIHPETRVKVIATDTRHNPAASVRYRTKDGRELKLRTMERLSPILSSIFAEDPISQPSFELDIHPEVAHVFEPS
jgi:hypothetical protein